MAIQAELRAEAAAWLRPLTVRSETWLRTKNNPAVAGFNGFDCLVVNCSYPQ